MYHRVCVKSVKPYVANPVFRKIQARQLSYQFFRLDKQRGFLIPLSLFIIIFLGILSLAMSRLSGGSQSSSVLEALSVQAFYAAETGAQLAMYELLFDVSSRTTASTNCASVDAMADVSFTVTGLKGCSADLRCTVTNDASNTTSIYTITSASSCGSNEMTTERTVSVEAFIKD